MDQILIDGRTYRLISRISAARKNTLPKHTLEDATTATDHLIIGQPTLDLTLILWPGEYEILEALSREQRLFRVVTPQGTFNNVAVASIGDEYGRTANTTQCALSLAVQHITKTETRPAELDGILLNPADLTGATTVPVADCPDDATVEQLKKYYLDHFVGTIFDKEAERRRLAGMTTRELWETLVETEQYLEKHDQLKAAIATDQAYTDTRQRVDHEIGGYLLTNCSKFTWGSDTYGIVTRKEGRNLLNSELGEIFDPDAGPAIHAEITRSRDNAVVYRGLIDDLTPFEMVDPATGITLATLQYSAYNRRLYIA